MQETQTRVDAKGTADEGAHTLTDNALPGRHNVCDARWQACLDELVEARRSGTRLEGRLAAWLKAQRRAHTLGTLRANRAAALGTAVHGWIPDPEGHWRARAEDVADHLDLTGKLPALADDPSLYRWLAHQRRLARAGTLNRKRAKWLDKYIPGWRPVPAPDRWAANCTAVEAFVAANGQFPSRAVEAERKLARWVWTQGAAARKGGALESGCRGILDDRLRGWDGAHRTGTREQPDDPAHEQGKEST